MINLSSNGEINTSQSAHSFAFFRMAFRPFFLLGAIFSMLSVIIWALMLQGLINWPVFGGGLWWHIHEMLFGFAIAIVVGFLLTAVQTWTRVPSVKGTQLMLLVFVWCFARLTMLFPQIFPAWLIHFADLIFLPIATFYLARPIIKVKMWRNLMFIPLLLTMTFVNAVMHCAIYLPDASYLTTASTNMVILMALLMCIMGGRVFPMFTANGTKTPKVEALAWLEKLSIGILLIVALIKIFNLPVNQLAVSWLFIFAAVVHGIRAFRWRIWVTWKTPLVWSLHLSYWAIVLGLLLFGLDYWFETISHAQAVHTITVGAIGMMILAMISRVSLGHTGRIIQVGPMMMAAFASLYLAFMVRVFGPYWFDNYLQVIQLASLLWCIGYGIFIVIYLPILTKPRADGAPE